MSVLELMVALVVTSALAMIAIPGWQSMMARNRLSTTANELLGGLLAARTVAVSRQALVSVCAGNAQTGCHGDWSRGEWISFIDRVPIGVFGEEDELQAQGRLAAPGRVSLSANGPFNRAVVFRPNGSASWPSGAFAAGRLRVCAAEAGVVPNAVDLVLIGSGRAVAQPCHLEGRCAPPTEAAARCQ
ncbi:GspH/FimT family pseudopilin [Sinimarinibacterium thermocellulolyticum]|uniref:Type II secretion system protein H n=1 Tax=Sinimarinibacterium thermocellulolyticum TaxID=3170016 RepID=A0ABV2A7X1_9GAMM